MTLKSQFTLFQAAVFGIYAGSGDGSEAGDNDWHNSPVLNPEANMKWTRARPNIPSPLYEQTLSVQRVRSGVWLRALCADQGGHYFPTRSENRSDIMARKS